MGKQKSINKTNAMRILDTLKIPYQYAEYEVKDGQIDGVAVAQKVGKPVASVFKTLVTQGHSKEYYVFVIPVAQELDLKKAAVACGEKNVEMIAVKDINKVTNYIRGGCSPIGMKKEYPTYLDSSGQNLLELTCSAGKIGLQISLRPADLATACHGSWAELTKAN